MNITNYRKLAFGAALSIAALVGGASVNAQTADTSAVAPTPALQTARIVPGTGAAVTAGQVAVVQYTGWLYDAAAADHKGKQFDSSRTHGQPFQFRVGAGQVIRGWDQGVLGMKVGEQRLLLIPAEFGYGDRGAGGVIPPGATLLFEVELVGIQ